MKLELHEYQIKAVQFMLERCAASLYLEMGLGKSSITLATISILKRKKMIGKTLIVGPLKVVQNVWGQEIDKWDDFRHLTVGILHGPKKDKVLKEDYDIYLTNYESLKWLNDVTSKGDFPFSVVVLDELSKCKSTGSQRFKILRKFLPKFRYRYGLTGTPAANGLMDVFGQQFCIDQGATFGPYITRFRTDYFIPSGFGSFDWRIKPGADEMIRKKLEGKVLSMQAVDYLTLPDLVKVNVVVDLPVEARIQYLSMEKKLKIDLDEGKITAANSAVAVGKARQISGGSVYQTDDATGIRTAHHIHSAKYEALEDLIEELAGNTLLVFYEFSCEADAIDAHFKKKFPRLAGGMSGVASSAIVDAWNTKDIPVLLAQSAAASLGLNLQAGGHNIAWMTLPYDLATYAQANARLHRQSQGEPVFVYHILAKDTIDYAVLGLVNAKDKVQKSLLSALSDYFIGNT